MKKPTEKDRARWRIEKQRSRDNARSLDPEAYNQREAERMREYRAGLKKARERRRIRRIQLLDY